VRDRARKAIRKFTLLMEKKDSGAVTTATDKNKAKKSAAKPTVSPSQKSAGGFDWGDDEDDDFAPISTPVTSKPVASPAPVAAPKKAAAKKSAPKKSAATPPKQQEPPQKPVVQKISKAGWDDWDSDWSAGPSSSAASPKPAEVTPEKPTASSTVTKSPSSSSLKTTSFDDDEEAAGWDDFEPAVTISVRVYSSCCQINFIVSNASYDPQSVRKPVDDEPKPQKSTQTKVISAWGDADKAPKEELVTPSTPSVPSNTTKVESAAPKVSTLKASEDAIPSSTWDDDTSAWGADDDIVPTTPAKKEIDHVAAVSTPSTPAIPTEAVKSTSWDEESSAWGSDEEELPVVPKSESASPAAEPKVENTAAALEPAVEPEPVVPEVVEPVPVVDKIEADIMAEIVAEVAEPGPDAASAESPAPVDLNPAAPVVDTEPATKSPVDDSLDSWGDDDVSIDAPVPSSTAVLVAAEVDPPKPAVQKIDVSFDDEDW
jgi:hypothetical protein